jgi:hypothetical protein
LIVFAHAKWLKAVLQLHTSHLMVSPQCDEILTSLYAMVEVKTRNYNQILHLRGKLDMIVQQVTAQPEVIDEIETNKEALLVYQDDDELTDKLDDMLMPASDTDNDDWNEAGDDSSDDAEDDIVDVDDEDEPMANGDGDSSTEENKDK